jgi:succinyl-diaminopimelate desuccinylase
MQTALAIDQRLHAKYNSRNEYFSEPLSTFEPTRKENNVEAINIVPGEDVVYFDCRVLPQYDLEMVLANVEAVVAEWDAKTGAKSQVEVVQKQAAPQQLDADSEIAQLLKCALKQARGVEAKLGGIGGGTCAAFFRKAKISAVVWSTIEEVAHQPDEYCKIANMVNDAKVLALLALL